MIAPAFGCMQIISLAHLFSETKSVLPTVHTSAAAAARLQRCIGLECNQYRICRICKQNKDFKHLVAICYIYHIHHNMPPLGGGKVPGPPKSPEKKKKKKHCKGSTPLLL